MNIAPKIYKIRIVFTVAGWPDYKQIVSALRKMVLASGLPFAPAKVNASWPRLAYGPVLGKSQRSLGEMADLYFTESVAESVAQEKLSAAAPNGVCVLRVRRVPYALPSVTQLAEVMQYRVKGNFMLYHPSCTAEEFFGGKHIYLTMVCANGMSIRQDLKPFICSIRQVQPNELELFLQKSADKTTKPEYVLAAWLNCAVPAEAEYVLPDIEFIREALYWRDTAGTLHTL